MKHPLLGKVRLQVGSKRLWKNKGTQYSKQRQQAQRDKRQAVQSNHRKNVHYQDQWQTQHQYVHKAQEILQIFELRNQQNNSRPSYQMWQMQSYPRIDHLRNTQDRYNKRYHRHGSYQSGQNHQAYQNYSLQCYWEINLIMSIISHMNNIQNTPVFQVE